MKLLPFAAALLFSGTALAQTAPSSSSLTSGWDLTVGAGLRVGPSFEGADKLSFWGQPIVSLSRTGALPRFRAADDGISIGLFDNGAFRAGPLLELRSRRSVSDDRKALTGLGSVDAAFEPGIFAEYAFQEGLRLRAELRRGFGGHEGFVADIGADLYTPMSEPLRFSIGPRLSYASADAVQPYFGVTSAQSLASGLPVYKAGSGLRSTGALASVSYDVYERTTLTGFAKYDYLLGDVADSPLVKQRGERNQITLGANLTYRFSLPGF